MGIAIIAIASYLGVATMTTGCKKDEFSGSAIDTSVRTFD
jgi:hypothetical protein